MFNACDFTFAGEPSQKYKLMLYDFDRETQEDVSFGNTASIIGTHIRHRVQPIHYGVDYNEEPLRFTLIFGTFEPLDRMDIEQIMMWLTGYQDYQWLSIWQDDLEHVEFRCLVEEVTPIFNGWLPYAFKANFVCDCPYAYGLPFEEEYTISGTDTIDFDNDTSVREYLKPVITFKKASGVTEIKLKNLSDGDREFVLSDLPSAEMEITIDNNSGVITHTAGDVDIYKGFNGKLFRLIPYHNEIEVTGRGTVIFTGRTLHNVGA